MEWLGTLVLAVLLIGCQAGKETIVSETIRLPKGTRVDAVLMKELTSGGSEEGDAVPMMVSADIIQDGKIVVPKGSAVTGEITWSRSEGTLGSLTNSPARLKFKFKDLALPDGTRVRLSAMEDAAEGDYELNRDNTGKLAADHATEAMADKEENRAAIEALQKLAEGDSSEVSQGQLKEIASQLGMDASAQLKDDRDILKIANLIENVRGGNAVTAIATGGTGLYVDAALEILRSVGKLGSRLSRTLGGRNIRAYVGTPVTAYTAEEIEVKP